jgi:excisionase family DNA binding protein
MPVFKSDRRGKRELIGIEEFAAECGVSSRSIRRYVKDGILPAYRVGHTLLKLDRRDVDLVVRREEVSA